MTIVGAKSGAARPDMLHLQRAYVSYELLSSYLHGQMKCDPLKYATFLAVHNGSCSCCLYFNHDRMAQQQYSEVSGPCLTDVHNTNDIRK